jgi:hypothetical protein
VGEAADSAEPVDSGPSVDVIVLDGAAIANMLKPKGQKTFGLYAENIFVPYIKSQLAHCQRIDTVWDVYWDDSLKAHTRSMRGSGGRRRVAASSKIPKNWQGFMRISDNKTELFTMLAVYISQIETNKQIVVTSGTDIKFNQPGMDCSQLMPCSHEEADTSIFVHAAHASNCGYNKLMIRTVDTDVVVLAVAAVRNLDFT